jgi:hypothetical protein
LTTKGAVAAKNALRSKWKVLTAMSLVGQHVMQRAYGCNIWDGFQPNRLTPDLQGWNGDHPSLERFAAASTVAGTVVVDVGVWKGLSTITMANAMRRAGVDGCVIAIDTFLGSAEHWSGPGALFTRQHGLPDLYETFLNNVHAAGLTEYIVPLPQTSSVAALILQRLKITAALVHIDAAHEYDDVLRDAAAYWSILNPGGYLIGDDYHETWGGVVRAAGEFSAKVGRPLSIDGPKWIVQKPAA